MNRLRLGIAEPSSREHHFGRIPSHPDVEWLGRIQHPERLEAWQGVDALLVSDEFAATVRSVMAGAIAARVPTFHILDGAARWQNLFENPRSTVQANGAPFLQPLIADCMLVMGPLQAQILRWLGNRGEILPVGLPRFDQHPARACRVGAPAAGQRLLVATNNSPWYTDEQKGFFLPRFEDLVRRLRTSAKVQEVGLGFRTSGLVPGYQPVPGQPVPSLLEELAGAAAVITTPSTLAVESMLCGVPTLVYDPYAGPALNPSAWMATDANTVLDLLPDLLSPTRERARFQDSLVQAMVTPPGQAAERIVEVIRRWKREGHPAADLSPEAALPVPALGVGPRFGIQQDQLIGLLHTLPQLVAMWERQHLINDSLVTQLRHATWGRRCIERVHVWLSRLRQGSAKR
jgi:hypothetical protein